MKKASRQLVCCGVSSLHFRATSNSWVPNRMKLGWDCSDKPYNKSTYFFMLHGWVLVFFAAPPPYSEAISSAYPRIDSPHGVPVTLPESVVVPALPSVHTTRAQAS